jgi:DNA-binding response OmpR family regulator
MRIAVVDDDQDLLHFVQSAMREFGHTCDGFSNGAQLLAALRRGNYDVLLLDWHLPDVSGIELLQRIRADQSDTTGVIMLTNRAEPDAIVRALQSGADDYIVKPAETAIIAARAEAVNRRSQRGRAEQRYLDFGDYRFDRLTEVIAIAGEPVVVNSKEFALALLFFENVHRPLSRSYILGTIWHADPNLPTRTLDMHISRIRTKLGLRPENGLRIAAIAGYGYRMERFTDGDAG